VNPKIEIFQNMTGTTPAAWTDPTRGGELARSQFDRGADVVYAAAGATGLGVLQAAKDKGKLAIGVDSNQDYIHPGTILTSMIKRVDLAIYEAFKTAKYGTWKGCVRNLGVAENGVGYSLDQYNRKLITPEMEKRLEQARADIVAGKIKVTDYMASVRPRWPLPGPPARCRGRAGIDKRFGAPRQPGRDLACGRRSTASSARTAPASPP
jgi:basic membrane protein A